MRKQYWVYILRCENGAYYTGYTTDLARRYREHVSGTVKCKYTRSFKPEDIVQCWQVNDSKSIAMQLEKFIKNLSRIEKKQFIVNPELVEQLFECKVYTGNYY